MCVAQPTAPRACEPDSRVGTDSFPCALVAQVFLKEVRSKGIKLVGIGADNIVEGSKTAVS